MKSDSEAMLDVYKRNFPREPYREIPDGTPAVKMPVLMTHGLSDTAFWRMR